VTDVENRALEAVNFAELAQRAASRNENSDFI